jgi:hypothetical protein
MDPNQAPTMKSPVFSNLTARYPHAKPTQAETPTVTQEAHSGESCLISKAKIKAITMINERMNPTIKSVGLNIFFPRKHSNNPRMPNTQAKAILFLLMNFISYPIVKTGQAVFDVASTMNVILSSVVSFVVCVMVRFFVAFLSQRRIKVNA